MEIKQGDIFASNAQTLVNTVNCVGVMGKGIALEFKKRFPEMFADYAQRCKAEQVRLGEPYLYKALIMPWVLNFPTKDHWRSISKLKDIERGLKYLERHYREWGIESLAVPPLGCGHGQLEWSVVGPTLYRFLNRLDIPVELYAPYGAPHEELQPAFLESSGLGAGFSSNGGSHMKPGWVALVKILSEIEKEPYHHPVGRVSFQKIAYFATVCGIETGLTYERNSYGPFAPGMKRILARLENHGLIVEERQGRMLRVKVGPTFSDGYKAYEKELEAWTEQIERVTDLFLRMRTSQAELAATVHFAAQSLAAKFDERRPDEVEVLADVMNWKQKRRPPYEEESVASAIRNLGILGWLRIKPCTDLPVYDDVLCDLV